MPRLKKIPFSRMHTLSESGLFIKHFDRYGKTTMRSYSHRDDYYIIVLITAGSVAVEIDFERKELNNGDILILSPGQVHSKPADEVWHADGWMIAFSPEILSEVEVRAIEEYAIAPRPFTPGENIVEDIVSLLAMLERNIDNHGISQSLAAAVKSYVLSTIGTSDREMSGRYVAITVRLRKMLDMHLASEKSPAVYASMLNISEVYLNEAVKGATGLSVGAYIRGRVVVQAMRQLAYTSMSAKEIAYALGYDDYSYFSKLFKKHVGKSPTDYRKNLK